MQNICVSRYAHPKAVGWAGWVEPTDKSWIVFIGLDGRPLAFLNRDPATGAVMPDDPEERAAHLARIREEQPSSGCGIGQQNDGSGIYEPDYLDPHELGEVIHPLGFYGGGGDVEPRKPSGESR